MFLIGADDNVELRESSLFDCIDSIGEELVADVELVVFIPHIILGLSGHFTGYLLDVSGGVGHIYDCLGECVGNLGACNRLNEDLVEVQDLPAIT